MINKVKKIKPSKNNRKIVAIGGGEIVVEGGVSQTKLIDRRIIRLSGKLNPKLLFIPTASHDAIGYCNNVLDYFGTELGCDVEFLRLYTETDPAAIQKKIDNADIIYVGGGNTYAMMRRWRLLGVDKMLMEAYVKGTVMSGLSAGAICWFKYGASNSWRFNNPYAPMIRVSGLGLVDAVFCPHYNDEEYGGEHLRDLLIRTRKRTIAIDECCAIEIVDDEYRIISSEDSANAYLIYWEKGVFRKDLLPKTEKYAGMANLLQGV